jgi:acetoin utilization deacetylase AcuC-like enzyme
MSLILVHSEQFTLHQPPPGHPERPERGEVMGLAVDAWRRAGGEVVSPRVGTREQLLRVHDAEHVRRIDETAGVAVALDPDTYTSPETSEIARLAAGAVVDGVERVWEGRHARALVLVRPPGHHAERHRAMGFCFFNNVAVGAAHARALGASRVAIVDYDVHHGNGTQQIFEDDPTVLYVSLHQFPFYPGTGDADEIGSGPGRGFTVNLPLAVGAVDEDYRLVFAEIVGPILRQFEPDLLLVSAGFDAHVRDPLGGMRLTTPSFGAMTAELRSIADRCCLGRLVVVTEGGYDLQALAQSIECVTGVLSDERPPSMAWPAAGSVAASRGRAAVAAAKATLGDAWAL